MIKSERDELFDSKHEELEKLLITRRKKWNVDYLSYIDWDDIAQHIRHHVYKKIHTYNQRLPFANWANTIITRQIINLKRNHIGAVSPPCYYPKKCNYNEGGEFCALTPSGKKCAECPEYKKWLQTKHAGYQIKLAMSIDSPSFQEIYEQTCPSKDHEPDMVRAQEKLSKLIIDECSPEQEEVYIAIQGNIPDKEIIASIGITYNELKKIKKSLEELARELMENNEIFYS